MNIFEAVMLGLFLMFGVWLFAANAASLMVMGTTYFEQVYVYANARHNIFALVQEPWEVTDISMTTIERKEWGVYAVYVRVSNRETGRWTNNVVRVDTHGNIIGEELRKNMAFWDGPRNSYYFEWGQPFISFNMTDKQNSQEVTGKLYYKMN